MHRSGTSLLANALAAAGVPFGSNLLSQSMPDNPHGYGEHAEIVAIQEQLLHRLGREWHSTAGGAPLPTAWMTWPETRQARARLTEVVQRELSSRPLWACKDPRTSRLLPLWLDILEEADVEAIPVLCIRNPAEVAASLAERNGMPQARADAIWLAHQRDAITAIGERIVPVVDYAGFLSDPEGTLAYVFERIGMKPDAHRADLAAGIVKPALRHHVADAHAAETPAALLYDKLLRIAVHRDARLPDCAPPAVAIGASKVTVVMRTRNRPLFLPRGIRSVLTQTMPDWHLVIVNDGGPRSDVAAAIAPYEAALAGRLTVIHLPDHVGMEAASNRAIRERGDPFITIHDDDDSWDPCFLQMCLARLAATAAAGVVTGSMLAFEQVDDGIIVDGPRQPFRPDITSITLAEMVRKNMFPPIAFVFARSEWDSLGGFRADLHVLGDWDFNIRFLRHRPIAFVPEPLAFWHRRPQEDPYPNSDAAEHDEIEAAIRDEMLRGAGDQGLAIMGALAPVMERLMSQAIEAALKRTAAEPAPERTGVMRAIPIDAPLPARSHSPLRLMPTRFVEVDGHNGHAMSSMGVDPQLHYDLSGKEFWPGTYRATIPLRRQRDAGAVELFFAHDEHHSPDRKTVLWEEQPGVYGGQFSTARVVGHLRLDPMDQPGAFEAGLLMIERVRHGRRWRLPNFLCIGAQRSGTTWLHHQLRAHPSVFLPPCKELHFFDEVDGRDPARCVQHRQRFLAEAQAAVASAGPEEAEAAWQTFEWAARFAGTRRIDIDWYASLFADVPDDLLAGEITPAYALLSERVVRQIVRLMPDLKIIFMMRDPVERALSGAVHELTTAAGSAAPPSAAALAEEMEQERCTARSAYRRTIETWESCLPDGSFGCFFHDDIARDPAGLMRSVHTFLGVDPAQPLAGDFRAPVNANPHAPPSLDSGVRANLARRYRGDVTWLRQRFGDAICAWSSDGP